MSYAEDFPSEFFFIRTRDRGVAIDVYEGEMTNDANLIIWTQKMTDSINQLWMHEDGFLINKKSGLVMDVKGGALKKDKTLIQYARKAGLAVNQRWSYRDGYIFPQAAPHLVLDIRGGDFREGRDIFLNTKSANSNTQQWVIQPYESPRCQQDLTLLRPPIHERNFEFPRPEQIFDFYRIVYIERKKELTPEELAGAAAFKGIKLFVLAQKRKNDAISVPHARESLQLLVAQEAKQLLAENAAAAQQIATSQLMYMAEQAATSYFSREYEMSC